MSQTPGSAVLIVVLALAGLGMLVAFRGGTRSEHRLARHSRKSPAWAATSSARWGTAVFIVAMQWAVVWSTSDLRAWAVAPGAVRRFCDRPDGLRHRDHPPGHPPAEGSLMTGQFGAVLTRSASGRRATTV